MFRFLLCLLGILLALPLILLITFVFGTPITSSGVAYLIGYLLVVAGLIAAPWLRKADATLTFSGLLIMIAVACMRLILAKNAEGSSDLKMIELPSGKATRWVNYLVDEQDSILFGEAAMLRMGGVSSPEHENIASALHSAYSEIKATHTVFPSPFASTYLGFQNLSAFDVVIIEPEQEAPTKAGVIFLHGYMGNVTSQCWRIAQAVQKLGMVTVCPSTNWTGDWWTPPGEAMLRATFRYLREQGIEKIYLGGFSNGGVGVSRLAPKLALEGAPGGLFLIAGSTNGVEIKKTGLPVLVIQGAQDTRMPAAAARQFIAEVGASATYVELESDHFLIMKQPAFVQEAITAWLTKLEGDK